MWSTYEGQVIVVQTNFRNHRKQKVIFTVCDLTKSYAGNLGLNVADYSAHSLRAGFLTSGARRGASVFKMCGVSRHKSMEVLRGYVRGDHSRSAPALVAPSLWKAVFPPM